MRRAEAGAADPLGCPAGRRKAGRSGWMSLRELGSWTAMAIFQHIFFHGVGDKWDGGARIVPLLP